METYGIDSHKLAYHPRRVADWLEGKPVYPVLMEVGPSARCQQNCSFCAFDYLDRKQGPLISETYLRIMLIQAADVGVKSVVFAGEGEPYMNLHMPTLISWAKSHNLDVGVTTNGVLLDQRGNLLNSIVFLDWLRFSLDAATEETYRKLHGCHRSHFKRVVENIKSATELKRRLRLNCTIGVQALLLPENQEEMVQLAEFAKGWGVDYLTIKPFSKHPLSRCDVDFDYQNALYLEDVLKNFADNEFSIIFRASAMRKLAEERPYKQCLALPFATVLAASGDLYPCNRFLGDADFIYGNIYEECFPNIWEGEQKKKVLDRIAEMGVELCREICRLDAINRYLWQLRHPETAPHINFV